MADNFERAAGAISAETDGEQAVVAYYKDTYDKMMQCLEGIGLKEVATVRTRAVLPVDGVPTCCALCVCSSWFFRSSTQMLNKMLVSHDGWSLITAFCV